MATTGIFDSGAGGLSVLREIRKILPDEKYIYYSDNANCPYGEKSKEFITARACEITDLLLSKGADVIVVACNTATAAAISFLRKKYSVPFIGMEPAVKPAALGTKTGVIGVLATTGTLSGATYLNTKGQYAGGVKVVEHVGKGFVELVESRKLSGEETERTVSESLLPLLEAGADTIVLGCTHYPFLLEALENAARKLGYSDIKFIDPAPAIARRLSEVIDEYNIPRNEGYAIELLSSGPGDTLNYLYK